MNEQHLLTASDYIRMGVNAQSLICSLFSKVYDSNHHTTIDVDNTGGVLSDKLMMMNQFNDNHHQINNDDSLFWRSLVKDFRKLINNASSEVAEVVDVLDELFPSLTTTSDDDDEECENEETTRQHFKEEKITINRRWDLSKKTSFPPTNLNQIIERIVNNSKDDENQLIDIMNFLIQPIESDCNNDGMMKNIQRISNVKFIENPLNFHATMEECLTIYYCQSDSNQLENLGGIIKLFKFFTCIFRIDSLDLCSLKNYLLFEIDLFIPIVSIFCFSYHYKLRDAVFEFLKVLSQFPCLKESSSSSTISVISLLENERKWFEIISDKKIIQDSLTMYVDLTDCHNWMDKLGEETFKTHFLSLSYGEAHAIVKEYERLFFGTQITVDSEEEIILEGLAKKIDRVMSEFSNGEAFIKLSHRSPKDAAFKVHNYDSMVEEMVREWSEQYNLDMSCGGDGDDISSSDQRVSLKHSKYQSAISQICAQKCMKVKSGDEFIKLMTNSYRSHVDLSVCLNSDVVVQQQQQHLNNESIPIQIVIREWIDIPIWREVRTFIRNKKMTAMTQYFSSSFFPNVTTEEYQSMKRIILQYFEKVKDQIPLDDCCIDFVVIDLEREIVKIIELNSFGDNCGPAFFDWNSDRLLLYNGPLEFRVSTNSTIEKEYQLII